MNAFNIEGDRNQISKSSLHEEELLPQEDFSIINRLRHPVGDHDSLDVILPGQDVSADIRKNILDRTQHIAEKNTGSDLLLSDLSSLIELDPTDPTLNELKQNLDSGYLLGLSLFEPNKPATSFRNILTQEQKKLDEVLDSLKDQERRLLFKQTSEIIQSDSTLKEYLELLLQKSTANKLTRFESSFIRGFIEGVLPSYNQISSIGSVCANLSPDENSLLEQIIKGTLEGSVTQTNIPLKLEAFTTYVNKDITYGPESIKNMIKTRKYWALRKELESELSGQQATSLDVVHSIGGIRGFFECAGTGLIVGSLASLPALIFNGIFNFPYNQEFMNNFNRVAFLTHFMIPCAAIGAGIMAAYQIIKYTTHKRIGQPIEDKLNKEVEKYAQKLADDDSAWIAEGIKFDLLDTKIFKVKY